MPIVAEVQRLSKAKQSKAFAVIMFFVLFCCCCFFFLREAGDTGVRGNEMTDTSVSEKSPVLEARTTKLQFEFDK